MYVSRLPAGIGAKYDVTANFTFLNQQIHTNSTQHHCRPQLELPEAPTIASSKSYSATISLRNTSYTHRITRSPNAHSPAIMAAPKEGGFKMSLGGLKGKVGLKGFPAQKEVKRPRLALGDDEEDDSTKQQEISGWDAAEGGAVDIGGSKEKEAPRVIPALPNRNWRDDARRKQQLAKAPHTKAQNILVTETTEQPKIQYGLTILKKEEPQENGTGEVAALAEPMEDVKDNLTEEQRLDKRALDALVNGKSTDDELVIPLHSEEDALQNDLRDAPDAPTLDSYEATPIAGFGAALLRGMGWKDGEAIGKNGAPAKAKEIKRRPALLGIGAKEEAATGVEIGDFRGNKGKGKGKNTPQSYNPVALRNKVTGELITEEELKVKLEQQDMVQDEKPKKERRRYSDDEQEDEKRRERRKDDRPRDRRRDDDYESERRRDRDRKDDRRRDKDDFYDSDRRRDKRKDKYRDEEYDSERRREKRRDRDDDYDSKRRHRSRSPSDKKRGRYRSRSPDSKRDRDRRDRSRDSDDRRKRRRDYGDERDERKRRH